VTDVRLAADPAVRGLLRCGVARAEGVEVGPARAPLLAEYDRVVDDLRGRHAGRAPAEIEALRPARELYRAFGIDPTKTRPSSESLLRRVLQSKPLPRVSNAVDLCTVLSLRFLLPLGLYDAGRIRGPVRVRRGASGESYAGIRKGDVHLEGKPVLADAEGAFGNPTSDSARTCVDGETRELLLVVFAPFGFDPGLLAAHARAAAEGMRLHLQHPGAPEPGAWTLDTDPPQ